jgi:hypothetical protein
LRYIEFFIRTDVVRGISSCCQRHGRTTFVREEISRPVSDGGDVHELCEALIATKGQVMA